MHVQVLSESKIWYNARLLNSFVEPKCERLRMLASKTRESLLNSQFEHVANIFQCQIVVSRTFRTRIVETLFFSLGVDRARPQKVKKEQKTCTKVPHLARISANIF